MTNNIYSVLEIEPVVEEDLRKKTCMDENTHTYCGKYRDVKNWDMRKFGNKVPPRASVLVSFRSSNKKDLIFYFPLQTGNIKDRPFISDFGGRCEPLEHPAQTAFRELEEESLGIFSQYLTTERIDACDVYIHENPKSLSLIVWLEIDEEPPNIHELNIEFSARKNDKTINVSDCTNETHSIIAIPSRHINAQIANDKVNLVYNKRLFWARLASIMRSLRHRYV